ncbi:hypothetical protein NKI51_14095 [Mesorhizobium australicum]|uniref:hypothetical protein n=1 Tax=Mesorhizobium australicum TaxID=536018 RepID=UPI0033398BD3
MTDDITTITVKAEVAAFDHAAEEKFKPALRKAIAEVMDEFFDDAADFVSISESGA